MPASRDKSQKFTFVYSNLYQIYRKGKDQAKAAVIPGNLNQEEQRKSNTRAHNRPTSSHILRVGALTHEIRTLDMPKPEVRNYQPVEFLNKRVESAQRIAQLAPAPKAAEAPKAASAPAVAPKLAPLQSISPLARLHQKSIEKLSEDNRNNDPTLIGLKTNLNKLSELHERLKFMLGELENIVKPTKK